MISDFLVCVEGDEDEIEEATVVEEAFGYEDAAQEYVRLNFANLDYPDEVVVFVKDKKTTLPPVKFTVASVKEVSFHAYREPQPGDIF